MSNEKFSNGVRRCKDCPAPLPGDRFHECEEVLDLEQQLAEDTGKRPGHGHPADPSPIAELRAENARLQERVKEAARGRESFIRWGRAIWGLLIWKAGHAELERGGWEALAKVRGEALPNPDKLDLLAEWLDIKDKERGYTDDEIQRDLRVWARKARDAIAMTPEEAGKREIT